MILRHVHNFNLPRSFSFDLEAILICLSCMAIGNSHQKSRFTFDDWLKRSDSRDLSLLSSSFLILSLRSIGSFFSLPSSVQCSFSSLFSIGRRDAPLVLSRYRFPLVRSSGCYHFDPQYQRDSRIGR